MKILAVYDSSGPKYHRILLPCYGLQQWFEIKVVTKVLESDIKDCDILFFNRLIAGVDIKTILGWQKEYGFKMVCDLDDHWVLGKDHVLYDQYKYYSISDRIAQYIIMSDVVLVTHKRLQEETNKLNGNCHILPNAIPRVQQFDIEKVPCDKVRLFWAGGITHRKDLELLRRPLQLIKRDKVKFVISGFVKNEPEWKEMAKIFTTDSSYNADVYESLPVNLYYKAYQHCDISLIPLVNNEFNRHKSNLKILEAANIEAPVIVSRVHPYMDFPEHLVNYVDVNNTWYSRINKLVNDEELRRAQGKALREYCDQQFNFDKITEQRKQIFNEAIQQRQTGEVQAEAESLGQ